LTATATPSSISGGTSFTISGVLTANGAAVPDETVVLVFGWNQNTVTVTTGSDGSYTYLTTAPARTGSYNVQVFFLGDYGGSPQYLPSVATVAVTVT
jgi:hypothetical protein